MYEEYNPGFARHKGGAAGQTSRYLWDEGYVAIHWREVPSADPEDYEGRGATEISNLNQFATRGAIVGASYRDVTKTEMLVGVVREKSDVTLLSMSGSEVHWEEQIAPGTGTREAVHGGEGKILKALPLVDVKRVSIEEYPILFEAGVRPRHWSVCNWWNGEPHLRAIVNETSKPFDVSSLQPNQLEVVCEEYLRIVDDGYSSLDSVGGQTADVDISGVSGDTRIRGQVTMGKRADVEGKVDALADYSGESTQVLMFAPRDSRPGDVPEGVTFLPVETIFSTVALNPSGRTMLEHMLNISGGQ